MPLQPPLLTPMRRQSSLPLLSAFSFFSCSSADAVSVMAGASGAATSGNVKRAARVSRARGNGRGSALRHSVGFASGANGSAWEPHGPRKRRTAGCCCACEAAGGGGGARGRGTEPGGSACGKGWHRESRSANAGAARAAPPGGAAAHSSRREARRGAQARTASGRQAQRDAPNRGRVRAGRQHGAEHRS